QRVTAAGPGTSESPPRMPGRPAPRRAERAEKPDRKHAKPTDGTRESVAARLARKLTERHGVHVFGFDTAGVPENVLTEIVAAVDDVLPRYPEIDLRAIGIDELPDGELTRLEWDSVMRPASSGNAADSADASERFMEPPASPTERVLVTARVLLAVHAAT